MEKIEYTLQDDDSADSGLSSAVDNLLSDIPDHQLAGTRRQFIADVLAGALPDHAAVVHGLEGYDADPALSHLVNQAEATCKVNAQKALYSMATSGRQVPATLWYWLEARCGYDRKTQDETLPQTVNVERRVVE
ncbi:MAG: hypothetical protein IT464_12890 [Planctomycetes bacterium]|nr:hypothetical protein [Planctomycetota bacterium]